MTQDFSLQNKPEDIARLCKVLAEKYLCTEYRLQKIYKEIKEQRNMTNALTAQRLVEAHSMIKHNIAKLTNLHKEVVLAHTLRDPDMVDNMQLAFIEQQENLNESLDYLANIIAIDHGRTEMRK